MTRLERTIRQVSDLRDFYLRIRRAQGPEQGGQQRAVTSSSRKTAGSRHPGSRTSQEKSSKVKCSRLAWECAKFDPEFEQALAEEGISGDTADGQRTER